jgi:glycosyltransferase involved in cell wall biosynthesis
MLPHDEMIQVLQASSVHVYLTRPFVLSWSMMEAMACGCLVVASDTPPVREVIENGKNGLLVDFFSPEAIAGKVAEVLDRPEDYADIRAAARDHVVRHYSLKKMLPTHLDWIRRWGGKD